MRFIVRFILWFTVACDLACAVRRNVEVQTDYRADNKTWGNRTEAKNKTESNEGWVLKALVHVLPRWVHFQLNLLLSFFVVVWGLRIYPHYTPLRQADLWHLGNNISSTVQREHCQSQGHQHGRPKSQWTQPASAAVPENPALTQICVLQHRGRKVQEHRVWWPYGETSSLEWLQA